MTIDQAVIDRARERGIEEVVHFTTSVGLAGVLADGQVHSRDQLRENQYLESLIVYNAQDRSRDVDWHDYVNLSVTKVNFRMLEYSERSHRELWWAVLAFDVEILGHPDVWFTTTNNAYNDTVRRGQGILGFEDMFSDRVPWGHYGSVCRRRADHPTMHTTDPQAEVLYPRSIPLDHLRAIHVRDDEHLDDIAAYRAAFDRTSAYDLSQVAIETKPSVFD